MVLISKSYNRRSNVQRLNSPLATEAQLKEAAPQHWLRSGQRQR